MKSKKDIKVRQKIDAQPEIVFKALTDETIMEKWFCPLDRGYTAEVSFPGGIGSAYRIDMIDTDRTVYTHTGLVEEIVPAKKLALTWNSHVVNSTNVVIQLIPKGDATEVKLVHSFNSADEIGDHEKNWAELLDNLRRLLED